MERFKRVVTILSSSISMSRPSLKTLATVKEITGAHRAYIYLFDVRQEFLHAIGDKEDLVLVEGYGILPKSYGKLPGLIRSLEPFVFEDLKKFSPEDGIAPGLVAEGDQCAIAVPIISGNELLGMMGLVFRESRNWDANEIEFITAIGQLVAVSVRMELTFEKIQELAIIQERRRLSQVLHDNFSQLISALSMRAEAARLTCEDGDLRKVEADIERMIVTTREIQNILRDEMISLRSDIAERTDLLPLIHDRIARFQQFSSITIKLDEDGIQGPIVVPSLIGSQFIRILQECLSNVRRHSNATQVKIRVKSCDNRLCLEIEDNGQGFDADTIPEDRLGLQIVRERAQEVGGSAYIHSTPGMGVRVHVELPILPLTETKHER